MRPAESFIGQPIRSLQTMLRFITEADDRLPTVVPDGIYGQPTMTAVSAFQRLYGLSVTGVTDQETWERIVDVYDDALIQIGKAEPIEIIFEPGQIFRTGDSSPYLFVVQGVLQALALDFPTVTAPSPSGVLDIATSRALREFQQLAALPVTGELDRKTWRHLSRHFTLFANRRSRFL
jgi:peptidoglycan hydrolase-like protein with peptidoglycan-binding domain